MSLTGVLLSVRHDSQAEIAIMMLEENCMGGGWFGRGPGHRSRSPKARCERGAQRIAVHVVEAMWRIVRDYSPTIEKTSKEKTSFRELGRLSVEALGIRF